MAHAYQAQCIQKVSGTDISNYIFAGLCFTKFMACDALGLKVLEYQRFLVHSVSQRWERKFR